MSGTFTKKLLLTAYAHGVAMDNFKGNKIFLVTPAGIISGIPVLEKDENDMNVAMLQAFNDSAVKIKAEISAEATPADALSEYFVLKDVQIQKDGSATVSVPALTVFCDQIIGITIGRQNTANR